MESVKDEIYLKKLTEEAENIKENDIQINIKINAISLQNDFLQKNIEWLKIFLGLLVQKETRESKFLDSQIVNQFSFNDLIEKIFDKGLVSNLATNDLKTDLEPLIKTMDEVIKDTETVYEFYNNIPIVQTYNKINVEYTESETTLKILNQQIPILEEDNQNFKSNLNERNRLIVRLVENSKNIINIKNEIQNITNDFCKTMKIKDDISNKLNKKLQKFQKKQVEYENINKVKCKFTLSHIDIFKIPSFPTKIPKNTLVQAKLKEIENKNDVIKSNKSVKAISTFPMLPLYRNSTININEDLFHTSKSEKGRKIQIIENKIIKSADLTTKNFVACSSKTDETLLIGALLVGTNKKYFDANENNKLNDISTTENNEINLPDKFENLHQQKSEHKDVELKEKQKDFDVQENKIVLPSFMDDKEPLPNMKRKSIDQIEIPKEKINTDLTLEYLKKSTLESDLQITSSVKRFRTDYLNHKELVIPQNPFTLAEKKNEKCSEEIFLTKNCPTEKLSKENIKTKDDIINLNFDEISLGDSDKFIKSAELDFNFDGGGNMNFDDTGNGNNFFVSGDFASDNQYEADCESFKF